MSATDAPTVLETAVFRATPTGSLAVVRLERQVVVLRVVARPTGDRFDYQIDLVGDECVTIDGGLGPYFPIESVQGAACVRADDYLRQARECTGEFADGYVSDAVAYLEAVEAMGATTIAVFATGDVVACRHTDRVARAVKLLPTNSAGALDAVRLAIEHSRLGGLLAFERRIE